MTEQPAPPGDKSPPADTPTAPPAQPVRKGGGCAVFLGFFLIIAVIGGISKSCSSDDSGTGDPPPTNYRASAYSACENYVEAQLKAPATAVFAGYSASTVAQSGTRYIVQSYVDAENSFGAMLRTTFVCTVELRSGRFYLDSLTGF